MPSKWRLSRRFSQLTLWNKLGALGSCASIVALALWFWPQPAADELLQRVRSLERLVSQQLSEQEAILRSRQIPATPRLNGASEDLQQSLADIEEALRNSPEPEGLRSLKASLDQKSEQVRKLVDETKRLGELILTIEQKRALTLTAQTALEETAVAVLREFNSVSIAINREFGGSICQDKSGRYVPSAPRMGVFSDQVEPSACIRGAITVGRYHTHGVFGAAAPSGADFANADALVSVRFFVSTPCGSILTWAGPNSASSVRAIRPCGST